MVYMCSRLSNTCGPKYPKCSPLMAGANASNASSRCFMPLPKYSEMRGTCCRTLKIPMFSLPSPTKTIYRTLFAGSLEVEVAKNVRNPTASSGGSAMVKILGPTTATGPCHRMKSTVSWMFF